MAKNGKKYTVGTEHDTGETAKHQGMNLAGQYIASFWRKMLYPTPYQRTFDVGGTLVEVSVREQVLDDTASEQRSDE